MGTPEIHQYQALSIVNYRVVRTLKFPVKKRCQARGQQQEKMGYNEDIHAVTGP